MDLSPWEILQSHPAMWVIAAFSVMAIGVWLERAVAQWKFMPRARSLSDTVTRCLTRGALNEGRSACERSRSPLADIYLAGYERLGRVKPAALQGAVNRERIRVTSSLKRNLWILGTIGATAPFVGLFGTVIGIMDAFGDIAGAGQGGLDVVSGGISIALYATAAGILVAVEAVVIYNYFNQKLARIAVELRMMTDEFLELLDEHAPGAMPDSTEDGPYRTGRKTDKSESSESSEEVSDGARSAA